MSKVNWTWNDDEKIPNQRQMQSNVLSLAFSAFKTFNDREESECSSGGFYVTIMPNKDIKITFKESDNN